MKANDSYVLQENRVLQLYCDVNIMNEKQIAVGNIRMAIDGKRSTNIYENISKNLGRMRFEGGD